MSLDKMTQSGLIHEFEDVSSGPHPSKFCFVLGAGASKTSGIKTGQELVITKQITRPTIIKIHRDLLFDPKNTAKDVGILHEAWERGLDIIFSEFHPIFIGYAGNDKSLMDFLIKNKGKFNSGEWKFPYWAFYKSDIIPKGQVKEFLEESGGYYINCNGFDELMCLMGAELGYQMPTEEMFLEDTKNRYHKLCEAFKNIVSAKDSDKKQGQDTSEDESPEIVGSAVQKITRQSGVDQNYIQAIILHNKGEYEKAEEIERTLVKGEPENAYYHATLGVTLHEMGKYEEAVEEKKKAVELEPENADFHNSLGITLHALRRYEEAAEEKKRAVEIEPENARYHASLGVTLHEMGKYEEAVEELKKATELEPENSSYLNDLNVILSSLKR